MDCIDARVGPSRRPGATPGRWLGVVGALTGIGSEATNPAPAMTTTSIGWTATNSSTELPIAQLAI